MQQFGLRIVLDARVIHIATAARTYHANTYDVGFASRVFVAATESYLVPRLSSLVSVRASLCM